MNKPIRFWEIDTLRGIAIIMMITFHFLFDLYYFAGYGVNVYSGFWLLFARTTALIFIFLVGISLTLSYARVKGLKTKRELRLKYLARGLRIFSWGLLITLITWIFLPRGFIVFGVLHMIGVSIILAYLFLKFRVQNLLLGIAFIIFGIYLAGLTFNFPWLMPLGFKPVNFYTFDYFPIFPWFGVVLIGLFFGNLLYPNGMQRFKIPNLSVFFPINLISFLGRHSLLIYLIHQPILIALLYLFIL